METVAPAHWISRGSTVTSPTLIQGRCGGWDQLIRQRNRALRLGAERRRLIW